MAASKIPLRFALVWKERDMQVNIEDVKRIAEERAKINRLQFDKIVWFENGVSLEIPQEVLDNWEFIGLNNMDFITTGHYLTKWVCKSTVEHMNKYDFCTQYWIYFDVVCMLEDRQDNGQLVDEDQMSKARSDFERHKRTCVECKRPDANVLMVIG